VVVGMGLRQGLCQQGWSVDGDRDGDKIVRMGQNILLCQLLLSWK